jgi:DNA-binding XRE family transcriptional regulator
MAKGSKKATLKKNELGVENSLVNNINARKEKGISRDKAAKTVDKKSYKKMEDGWDKKE